MARSKRLGKLRKVFKKFYLRRVKGEVQRAASPETWREGRQSRTISHAIADNNKYEFSLRVHLAASGTRD